VCLSPRFDAARLAADLARMDETGLITLTGRSIPSFCGTKTGCVASSRKIIRVMNVIAETVVPSYGQL